MLNQAIIVGKVAKEITLNETQDRKQVSNIILEVKRSFKNEHGTYDSDFIHCTLWSGIAVNAAQHCQVGSVIGVKGRIKTKYIEIPNGQSIPVSEVVAEKITFISKTNNDKNLN